MAAGKVRRRRRPTGHDKHYPIASHPKLRVSIAAAEIKPRTSTRIIVFCSLISVALQRALLQFVERFSSAIVQPTMYKNTQSKRVPMIKSPSTNLVDLRSSFKCGTVAVLQNQRRKVIRKGPHARSFMFATQFLQPEVQDDPRMEDDVG